MAKNPLNYQLLVKAVENAVSAQPYHIQHWVILSGDGMGSDLSYIISYSYIGVLAPTGKEVFNNFTTPLGNISGKNFVAVTTFFNNLPEPTRDQMVILYDFAGNSLGRFKIIFVQSFYTGTPSINANSKFKTDLHLEKLEG